MNVIIVGKGSGWEKAPPLGDGYQVWGVNDICLRRPVDLAFNIHDLIKHVNHELFNKTIAHVNANKIPIVTQETYSHIPTAIRFPIEWFENSRVAKLYFTNSIDYMVAYAWYLNGQQAEIKVETLEMYGVVMAVGTEYGSQRSSLSYWLGLAHIPCVIHEPTFVFDSMDKGLYGYDWDEEDKAHVIARQKF